MLYRSTLIGRLLLILSTSLTGAGVAQADDAKAPKVQSNGDRVWKRLKPEMYKAGWVDFDKDNRQSPFEDPRLPIEDRVTDLLGRMTQAEKLGQTWQRPMRKESDLDDQKALAAGEIGSYLGIDGNGPGLRNRLQRIAVEESRLGVPLVFGFDTIHGLRTVFPIPLAMSCAWDPAMIEKTNAIAARESKAVGVDWAFAPMVDIARDPRWGQAITASALVTNTGDRRDTTVVQWYIRDHAGGGARPLRELRGFERVTPNPGESRTVSFVLNVQSLGYWLSDGAWGVEPGGFSNWAGPDSATDQFVANVTWQVDDGSRRTTSTTGQRGNALI